MFDVLQKMASSGKLLAKPYQSGVYIADILHRDPVCIELSLFWWY